MLKKTLIVLVVITAGMLTGYFSGPIYNAIWPESLNKVINGTKLPSLQDKFLNNNDKDKPDQEFISAEEAVNAVRAFPVVEQLKKVAELDGVELVLTAGNKPAADYPVWLVEVTEENSDKIPEPRYFQVDAVSGKVLDLLQKEVVISGVSLGMTRREVEELLGKPQASKRTYDSNLKQNFRIYTYPGLTVSFNAKGAAVELTASEPDQKGPREVKVGDVREVVLKALGKARNARPDLLVYSPADTKDAELLVRFDNDGKVSEITVEKAPLAQ